MLEKILIAHILSTPRGTVLSCTSLELNKLSEPQLRKELENIKAIWIKDRENNYHKITLVDFQITSSVGNNHNLHLLIDSSNLPKEVKEGTPIYFEEVSPKVVPTY
ncbi:MAG: hypothetical protein QNJ54_16310 [Prochloraceae cyanobacterium]|nr:hypothetical protein [Prochloraceae cyanobacterium]